MDQFAITSHGLVWVLSWKTSATTTAGAIRPRPPRGMTPWTTPATRRTRHPCHLSPTQKKTTTSPTSSTCQGQARTSSNRAPHPDASQLPPCPGLPLHCQQHEPLLPQQRCNPFFINMWVDGILTAPWTAFAVDYLLLKLAGMQPPTIPGICFLEHHLTRTWICLSTTLLTQTIPPNSPLIISDSSETTSSHGSIPLGGLFLD